jgi:NAD(P)H-quinone oxidoreductase subunit 4
LHLDAQLLFLNTFSWIYWCCFFFLGTSCDRIRLAYLEEMGGISIFIPKIFVLFSSFSMASLELLGLSGFIAEFLVFLGFMTSQKYFLIPKIIITFVMTVGIVLTPIYLLSILRKMFYDYKLFYISK